MKKNKRKLYFLWGAITLGSICCINYKTLKLNNNNNLMDNVVGVYLKSDDGSYIKSDTIPQSGYKLNSSKSTCNNNVTPSWSSKGLKLSNLKKGTSCYLYFDELETFTFDEVIKNKNISIRTDFTVTYTADTTGTLFTAEDDDGTSYYYAGAPTDNYVKFAGKYWRIIRVNGDGSIRMIYAGDVATIDALDNKSEVLANGYNDSTTQYTQTETSAFNTTNNNNMNVGFMYTSGQVHGLGTSSTIKGKLDTWYNNNLANYANKIDTNVGFCGDREPSTNNTASNGSGGTGTTTTYYGSFIRLIYQLSQQKQTSARPTLKCANSSDLYTKSGATKGNKALTNPIGLISAEEVAYAGGLYGTNNIGYYLATGNNYWTLSPRFFSSYAYVFCVISTGLLSDVSVNGTAGVRPVINLKADTIFKEGGLGTAEHPYVVEGAE